MLWYTSKKPILSTKRSSRFRQTGFLKDNFKVFKKDFFKPIIPRKRKIMAEDFVIVQQDHLTRIMCF
ncbi:MAG: hypothetical protein ISS33_00045 [Candidatus Omnitrophica bacterium]|nr:hypothetical protein [Candidatus Omnitrophota bacterium]